MPVICCCAGDVVGPAFPTMPVNATSLLSKPFYCGEQNMFSFAANLYTLLYLRLTNQRDVSIEKQAFKYLNLGGCPHLAFVLFAFGCPTLHSAWEALIYCIYS